MTRTSFTIQARAIFEKEGNAEIKEVYFYATNTKEKTVNKARAMFENDNDCKVIKSSEVIGKIQTSMTDEKWFANCEYGEFTPLEISDEATDRDEATDSVTENA